MTKQAFWTGLVGGLLLAGAVARADEPQTKPEFPSRSPAAAERVAEQNVARNGDRQVERAAVRAEVRRELSALRAELRKDREASDRPESPSKDRRTVGQKAREVRAEKGLAGAKSMRELIREHREDLRERRRNLIRNAQ
ncbi:MAG TPA: hypothetical protein PKE31_00165 [Pseudomonadota bacterium]|nr:hypothetical protein [Pseudomonadota bacterium]